MHKKPSFLRSLLSIMPFIAQTQELIQQQHGNVAAKKVVQRKKKAKGGRYWSHGPYRPGKLGLSAVSAAIQKHYGAILSRRERKQLGKQNGQAFVAFYCG